MSAPERLTDRPLPPYRFLPGRGIHPTRNPAGHSFGQPPLAPAALSDADWRGNEDFLFGVDLFNYRYWWEAHDVFEALWHASGRRTPAGHFLQALIQCAAAHLQAEIGHPRGAQSLLRSAQQHAAVTANSNLGIDLTALLEATARFIAEPTGAPARLTLSR